MARKRKLSNVRNYVKKKGTRVKGHLRNVWVDASGKNHVFTRPKSGGRKDPYKAKNAGGNLYARPIFGNNTLRNKVTGEIFTKEGKPLHYTELPFKHNYGSDKLKLQKVTLKKAPR